MPNYLLAAQAAPKEQVGYVSQVIGAVVDVYFENGVPPVLNALKVQDERVNITLEIVQHLDPKTAR